MSPGSGAGAPVTMRLMIRSTIRNRISTPSPLCQTNRMFLNDPSGMRVITKAIARIAKTQNAITQCKSLLSGG